MAMIAVLIPAIYPFPRLVFLMIHIIDVLGMASVAFRSYLCINYEVRINDS